MIEVTDINGKVAYETSSRGVDYVASQRFDGVWVVTSSRLRGSWTVKRFETLSALVNKVKVFSGLDALIDCEAVA